MLFILVISDLASWRCSHTLSLVVQRIVSLTMSLAKDLLGFIFHMKSSVHIYLAEKKSFVFAFSTS